MRVFGLNLSVISTLLLFLLSSHGAYSISKVASSTSSLQQVQVLFRHGLRNPEKPYPGDPYSDPKYWPEGWGSLTKRGKKEQYDLGKFLRERYGSFVEEAYSSGHFYAVSSDSDRTVTSLLANMAGLLPPTEGEEWNVEIPRWQPIPLRTIARHLDLTIRGTAACPKFDLLWKQLIQSEEFARENAHYYDLYHRIGLHTGENYSYPIQLTSFYEALIIQEAHNFTLPTWAREIFHLPQSADFLSFAFSLPVKTEEMKRLRGGPLLTQIISNMKSCIAGEKQAKRFLLYSGHDITLARIMDTMDLFNPPHIPDFNAAFIIELHRKEDTTAIGNDNHYVEIYYRNGDRPLRSLHIGRCGYPCSLESFERIFKSRMIDDEQWYAECKSTVALTMDEPSGFWSSVYKDGLYDCGRPYDKKGLAQITLY